MILSCEETLLATVESITLLCCHPHNPRAAAHPVSRAVANVPTGPVTGSGEVIARRRTDAIRVHAAGGVQWWLGAAALAFSALVWATQERPLVSYDRGRREGGLPEE